MYKSILFMLLALLCSVGFAEDVFESKARWIWFPAKKSTAKNCYYRWVFDAKEPVKSALLTCYQDDVGVLYVNEKYQRSFRFKQIRKPLLARRYEVGKALKKGKNLFAWHITNNRHTGGLIMMGEITYESGKKEYIFSNKNWKAAASAPKGWEKLSFDDSKWAQAWEIGGALVHPWNSVGAVYSNCLTPEETIAYQEYKDHKFVVDPAIGREPQHVLKLKWKNNIPYWVDQVGNVEMPPIITVGMRNPASPYRAAIRRKLYDMGVKIVPVELYTGDTDLGEGKYDFSLVEENVATMLKSEPDLLLEFYLRVGKMDSWLEKHPDEVIGYATGPADNKILSWGSLDVGGRGRFPSMASKPFALELERTAKVVCDYIKSRPWGKRVVIFRFGYGCYGEWHYYGMGGQMPDTGKAMTKAFQAYAKQKYGSVGVLRAAWGDNNVTFENITVPGEKERYGKMLFLRDGIGTSRKVMDYYECHQNVISNLLLRCAAVVKKEMPHVQFGAYYGYIFSMSEFPSEGQTVNLEQVLADKNIDFLSAPSDYNAGSRRMGGAGMPRIIPGVFIRNKKLALTELDYRTYLSKRAYGNDGRNGVEDGEVLKRDITISLFNGIGMHIYDTGGVECAVMDDPDMLVRIKSAIDNWKEIRDHKKPSTNRIAVIFNSDELMWHGYPTPATQKFARFYNDYVMHAVYRSGYTFDLLTMYDLMLSKKDYDCLVFLNALTLTADQQKLIKKITRRKGVTAIYQYAPGLVTSKGFSKENMYDLTGIKLDYALEKTPMTLTTRDGRKIGDEKLAEAPRVFSIDKDAEVLAHYPDKKVAMVKKQLPSGATAVFCGVPVNQAWAWAKMFKDAKMHCVSPDGVMVRWENPFLLVHVRNAGAYNINLPEKAKRVKEMFSQSVIAENTNAVTLHSAGCKTWLLKLEK